MNENTHSAPRDAATTILIRDRKAQLEVLMLRKNANISYGGSWVFPGGVVDPEDNQHVDSNDELAVHKIAAVREAKEETNLDLQVQNLSTHSFWLTPKIKSKRFATWFFIANGNQLEQAIEIDNEEIVDYRWITPQAALSSNEIVLNGPSFVTLYEMQDIASVQDVYEFISKRTPPIFKPKAFKLEDKFITIYDDDHAYEKHEPAKEELEQDGPRHRLYMNKHSPWEYIKDL